MAFNLILSNLLSTMNFKFNIILGLITLLGINSVWAQSDQREAVSLTLEECLAYAFENSDSIKNALLDQKIAVAQVGETRAAGLPQITGNASLSKSYLIPVQLIPAQIFDPNAPEGVFAPVQFSPTYTGNASAQLE